MTLTWWASPMKSGIWKTEAIQKEYAQKKDALAEQYQKAYTANPGKGAQLEEQFEKANRMADMECSIALTKTDQRNQINMASGDETARQQQIQQSLDARPLFASAEAAMKSGDFDAADKAFSEASRTVASPLLLDLDGKNGIETTSVDDPNAKRFDHKGDGYAEKSGWVGKNDGILFLDKNGNGKIDNGNEVFGDNTKSKNGGNAEQGFAALSELDNNGDGKVNAQDKDFAKLKVEKGDGTQLTMEQAGVKSLNTGSEEKTNNFDVNKNEGRYVGSFEKTDGSTREMTDYYFQTKK